MAVASLAVGRGGGRGRAANQPEGWQLGGTWGAEQHQVWGGSRRPPAVAGRAERGRSRRCSGAWVWLLCNWDLAAFWRGCSSPSLCVPPFFAPFGGRFLGWL